MCEVAFSDGVAENLCEPTTMTPKETLNEAYRLGVAAVALAVLLLAGWIVKILLKRFGMKCRLPVTGARVRVPKKREGGGDIEMAARVPEGESADEADEPPYALRGRVRVV
ncbi:uncharacterized protein LOC111111663 isoform X2 [Crassostrea virginica]